MTKKKLFSGACVVALAAALQVSEVDAAGFQLSESSTTALGRAFSGAGIVGDDLSAIAYNPAGMSLFKGKMGTQIGATAVHIKAKFSGRAGPIGYQRDDKENPGGLGVVPHFYAVTKVNDRLNIGVGVFTPFGLRTNYSRDWAGAAMGVRSEVRSLDFNPSFSYKITDKLSVGAGVSMQYFDAVLTSNIAVSSIYAKVKGDSWGYGYNFGAMYEFTKDTRLGIAYRSKIGHNLEGDGWLNDNRQDVEAKITLPESLTVSAFHKLNSKIGLSAYGRWTKWSRFKHLTVFNSADNSIFTYTHENWRDTWSVGVGADYYVGPKLTVRGGIGFDRGPISTLKDRTPRIPDNDRMQLSLGFSYHVNDNVTLDFAYMHLFIRRAEMDHTGGPNNAFNATGVFKPSADLLSAALQVKF